MWLLKQCDWVNCCFRRQWILVVKKGKKQYSQKPAKGTKTRNCDTVLETQGVAFRLNYNRSKRCAD